MFKIHDGVIYRIGRFRAGYYVLKFPQDADPTILAVKLKSEQDAINKIKEDINNDATSFNKMS